MAMLATLLVAGVAGMLVKIGVCMSIGLHRYAAHAAFKCGPVVRFGLSVLGCLANQGGPIWWASQHRAHHKFCDGERDPHSAEQVGVVKAFVFFDRITNVNEEFAPRHLESLSIRVLDTFAGACVAVEFYLAHRFGGLPALWVAYVSATLCQTVTLWFNIVNHPPRQPGAPDKCDASDHTNSALVELSGTPRRRDVGLVSCWRFTIVIDARGSWLPSKVTSPEKLSNEPRPAIAA